MTSLRNIEPREYQKNITETAIKKNTLVVLPTGMGKTLIALLVAIKRLQEFPDSKILIMAPTRPLNAQHKKSFEKFTDLSEDEIILVTGKIKPGERSKLYKKFKVIVATPQTIENDLKNKEIELGEFSLAVFDEAHRCIKDYAYTFVAKEYKKQSKHPLILGLTASPGGSFEKINEIKKNLFIEAVEIRTEADEDVEKYVKPVAREWIDIELPEEFKMIKGMLEQILKDSTYWLKEHHFTSSYRPSKGQLLMLQEKIISRYRQGTKNYSLFWAIMKCVEAVKLDHALELLETQGISSLYDYLKKIEKSKKKTDQKIMKDPRMVEVLKLVENLQKNNVKHPKLEKLIFIVKDVVRQNPDSKIIVFANYRSTVDKINETLKSEGISSEILIGQATKERKGLTQDEQIGVLKRFASGEFNVLVGTSITEEGLDVPAVDYAIFYEPVASEIRSIQRRGRVGRQTSGKVIFLITKKTRDEAYYWAAFHKEKKMRGILYDMKNKLKKKKTLKDWVK